MVITDFSKKSDEEIVELVLEDADSLLYLMQRYEMRLKAYIMRVSDLRLEDAEDILQEVFIKVYENLNGFDRSLKFSSWIYRITYNQTISHFRKRKARGQQLSLEDSEKIFKSLMSDLNLQEELEKKMEGEVVRKLLLKLDKKYGDVLVLKFLEDKDYKEISDILKIPMGTVGTLVARAKAKLKGLLLDKKIKS